MSDPTYYTLTITTHGEGPPAPLRLRKLLKTMLRNHGLRCLSIEAGTATANGCGDGASTATGGESWLPLAQLRNEPTSAPGVPSRGPTDPAGA